MQEKPTTIEQTGKNWKLVQLCGAVSLLAGCPTTLLGIAADPSIVAMGLVLMVVGFVVFVGGRVGAWWNHG